MVGRHSRYLITHLQREGVPAEDRDLLRLGEDFPDLEGAAATNLPVMTSDVGKMRLGMQRLDGWLKRAGEEGDVAFATTAGDFYHAKKPVFDALEQKFKDMKAAFADLCGPSTFRGAFSRIGS